MKIYCKDNKIIIEIDKYQDATDAIGQKVGKIDSIIGVACLDKDGNEELGFSNLMDRTYKGAEPDISTIFLYSNLEKENFIKLCEELKIRFYEYPICAYCKKSIFGGFKIGDKGNMCYECEHKKELRAKKSSNKKYKYSSKDKELAELLYSLIKKENPSWHVKPNWDEWPEDIRKLREIDKRTTEQIEFVIKWCQEDEFWHKNILSPSKLRKQFNNLIVKIKPQQKGRKIGIVI